MTNGTKGTDRSLRPVVGWLWTGVAMIMVQVLLGGITRLTGSGLSITEWQPILGALPPMSEADWQSAFEKYRQIGQYRYINFDFNLSDFKFIYFWEWFHRLWARLIGLVFLIPFCWFLWRGMLRREWVIPLTVLFGLGILQGAIGWIMVQSGLNEDDVRVSHIRLAVHFMAAMGLLAYTFWFALRLSLPTVAYVRSEGLRRLTLAVVAVLCVQLVYGAFMAGLKAGAFAPTWPTINQQWWPSGMGGGQDGLLSSHNPLAVQFIHRGLGYLVGLLVLIWYVRARRAASTDLFRSYASLPVGLVMAQILLGIFSVLYSDQSRPLLWLGTAHQFTAMLLLLSLLCMLHLLSKRLADH
ncbi:MAG: heme A synthase [Bacteroidetes bacterium]|nr:heme A synthase [Bacteroidota bacterium]